MKRLLMMTVLFAPLAAHAQQATPAAREAAQAPAMSADEVMATCNTNMGQTTALLGQAQGQIISLRRQNQALADQLKKAHDDLAAAKEAAPKPDAPPK